MSMNAWILGSPIVKLVKPATIWRLKYGQIVMVKSDKPWQSIPEKEESTYYVAVIRQDTNIEDIEYLESFLDATLIG